LLINYNFQKTFLSDLAIEAGNGIIGSDEKTLFIFEHTMHQPFNIGSA